MVQKRLREFLDYMGISMPKFEDMAKISHGVAYRLNKNSHNSTFGKIEKGFPELNTDWLRFGRGEMLNPTHQINQHNINGSNQEISKVGGHADLRSGTFYNVCPEDIERIRQLEKEVEKLTIQVTHKQDIIGQLESRLAEYQERVAEYKERLDELKTYTRKPSREE